MAMETSALVVLERAERAARERRLTAGLEAERRIAAARAEVARIERDAETEAAAVAAVVRQAVLEAADREIAALEAGTTGASRPTEDALVAARTFVVAALLGEVVPGAVAVGRAPRAELTVAEPGG
jgi:vacuolar-type H+-ATPase subunit H